MQEGCAVRAPPEGVEAVPDGDVQASAAGVQYGVLRVEQVRRDIDLPDESFTKSENSILM